MGSFYTYKAKVLNGEHRFPISNKKACFSFYST